MELVTEKEKQVLGVLRRTGSVPVSAIARETLINRTALYHTLEQLQRKGLVTRADKEEAAYFQALAPDEYASWAKRQSAAVDEQAAALGAWLEGQGAAPGTLQSSIRYAEGLEGIKGLYADTWRDNKEKIIYAITDYDRAYAALDDFLEKEYFPDRVANKIRVKSLLPPSEIGKRDVGRAEGLLREMRFIEVFKNLGIEINVYGDKVAVIAFDKRKPTGILIKNQIIAAAFKDIFAAFWKSAETAPR